MRSKSSVFPAPSSDKTGFEKLPTEVALEIVQHLLPKDAINFESVSHASREKIANNPQIWVQHGIRPPISLDATSTLKQLWLSRVRTLSPKTQRALLTLTRPLDIFSNKALGNFSSLSQARHDAMEMLKKGVQEKNMHTMYKAFKFAVSYSQIAGIELPTLSDEMKAVYISDMQNTLSDLWNSTEEPTVATIETTIGKIRISAEKTGTAMPTLPVEKIRSVYLKAISYYVSPAESNGRISDTFRMFMALREVDKLAQKAEIEMPTISTEGMSEETKSACFEFLAGLAAKR